MNARLAQHGLASRVTVEVDETCGGVAITYTIDDKLEPTHTSYHTSNHTANHTALHTATADIESKLRELMQPFALPYTVVHRNTP